MTLTDRSSGGRLDGHPVLKWVVLPLATLSVLFVAGVLVALVVAGLLAERLLRRLARARADEEGSTADAGVDAGADPGVDALD